MTGLPERVKNPLEQPLEPFTTWSLDFVNDVLECGKKFRVLNIIDDSDRGGWVQWRRKYQWRSRPKE